MANETWKFVQAKSKQAMKQVLGIRDEKTRMKVTLPLAMAPVTQDDDMRWNPNALAQCSCHGHCRCYCSRCRQANPCECLCNPMHVSAIVRGAVLVRARACEPVSKRSL